MSRPNTGIEDPWSTDVARALVRLVPVLERTHELLPEYGFGRGLTVLRALLPRRGALSDSRIAELKALRDRAWEVNEAAGHAFEVLKNGTASSEVSKEFAKILRSWVYYDSTVTILLYEYAVARKATSPDYLKFRPLIDEHTRKAAQMRGIALGFQQREFPNLAAAHELTRRPGPWATKL